MDRRYKFRTASSIVGFIDFFLTLLAVVLLLGGLLILPDSQKVFENLFQRYTKFGVIATWILVLLVWTIMLIGAVKLVRATVGRTETAESIGRLIFWRNVNLFVLFILIIGVYFIQRNTDFASWIPQVVHFIFRVFGISIVSVHLSEIREFFSMLAIFFYIWATWYSSNEISRRGVLMVFIAIGSFVCAILKMVGIWTSCKLIAVTNSEDEGCRIAHEVSYRWLKASGLLMLVPVLTFGTILIVFWGCSGCAGVAGGYIIVSVILILLGSLHVKELTIEVTENAHLLSQLNP